MARKGDTPGYVNKMWQGGFDVLPSEEPGRSLWQDSAQSLAVYRRYLDELGGADVRKMTIHSRVSRLDYLC